MIHKYKVWPAYKKCQVEIMWQIYLTRCCSVNLFLKPDCYFFKFLQSILSRERKMPLQSLHSNKQNHHTLSSIITTLNKNIIYIYIYSTKNLTGAWVHKDSRIAIKRRKINKTTKKFVSWTKQWIIYIKIQHPSLLTCIDHCITETGDQAQFSCKCIWLLSGNCPYLKQNIKIYITC